MKILIRLPNWLGDGVMLTPIFEILKHYYKDAVFVLVGPQGVCDLFTRDKRVKKVFIDRTKEAKNRLFATYRFAKEIGKCDIAITFTNHFYSAFLLFATKSPIRVGFGGFLRNFLLNCSVKKKKVTHQVLSYAQILEGLGINERVGGLNLIYQKKILQHGFEKRKNIGIATGAAFGSAKAWLPEYFAQIVEYVIAQGHRVFLFGASQDVVLNQKIIKMVKENAKNQDFSNLFDLSAKTSVSELVDYIASLDLFIGNDSGAGHIAVGCNTPAIILFGPTHPTYCLPWQMKNCIVINKHLSCAPCQKRECPLGHHRCMKDLKPEEVILAIEKQLKKEEFAN
ncbi:lipopolysaccharide heptosyltransferase II [Helicobacter anatolicus]|uniref:lipopolysaccharide heptosyltransferase II n=1 Tax=Helicobacter anatolicus TaxID=2905874 RepID=UPI001E5593C5|nr:lipopolysaccharide heptosyltransferase II [Helicobacter anatolicus]MCE3039480.1 lipopolysaccharide heptosyltransferase II [Helicobacter anatolicus]